MIGAILLTALLIGGALAMPQGSDSNTPYLQSIPSAGPRQGDSVPNPPPERPEWRGSITLTPNTQGLYLIFKLDVNSVIRCDSQGFYIQSRDLSSKTITLRDLFTRHWETAELRSVNKDNSDTALPLEVYASVRQRLLEIHKDILDYPIINRIILMVKIREPGLDFFVPTKKEIKAASKNKKLQQPCPSKLELVFTVEGMIEGDFSPSWTTHFDCTANFLNDITVVDHPATKQVTKIHGREKQFLMRSPQMSLLKPN